MARRNRRGLKLIGVLVEPDLYAAIAGIAVAEEISMSETGRKLFRIALEAEGADLIERDLADEGYNDGLRRGLHEARLKIRGALAKDWE